MLPSPGYADGHAALSSGDWVEAKRLFEAALAEAETAEAHDGLGVALWWLNDVQAAYWHRTKAYVAYKRRGQLRRAARLAAWLAREQVFLNGNTSAMNGWFARADRHLRQAGPCIEASWVALFRASMVAPAPELARTAENAVDSAQEVGDAALEALALAFQGMALVATARVADGMACLDEAMAAATAGEVSDFMVVSEVFCVMLSACELAADLVRLEHWCRAAADFAQQHHCPFLSAYCRTTYGGLLLASGRWREAEEALTEAIEAFERGHRGLRVHAVLKLADLRVMQGRLEEAEVLLSGYEDYGGAALPLARYHLAQGQVQLARAVLEEALHHSDGPDLSHAPLLHLLMKVLLSTGDRQAAAIATNDLVTLAHLTGSDFLLAQADLAQGHLKRHAGDPDAARHFQAALDRLRRYEQSWLAGRAKLEMAYTLQESDSAGAKMWARAARATFERIGASAESDEVAKLLRDLGAAGRVGVRNSEPLTQRESEVLSLLAHGLTNREIADRLVITVKTVEHHVSQVLAKLGVRSRTEAAAYAASRGALRAGERAPSKDQGA